MGSNPADAGLLVIVPSRGRPESVLKVIEAWLSTDAYEDASLVFAIDEDDPRYGEYYSQKIPSISRHLVTFVSLEKWMPMVEKLNTCALSAAGASTPFAAISFMGDDHLPRTRGWARRFLLELKEMGTGIVYGDDGVRKDDLPTYWVMTPDIIRSLGRMVPAPVEHLYCDNSIRDLGHMAGCIKKLPDVLIEHVHPAAGKVEWDDGYKKVNSAQQYAQDGHNYRMWRHLSMRQDAAVIRALRESHDGQ